LQRERALSHILKAIIVVLLACSVASAMTVYLKNEVEVDADTAWRSGDTICVQVNSDLLLKFAMDEVDLTRTSIPRKMLVSPVRESAVRDEWWVGTWALANSSGGGGKEYIDFYSDGRVDVRKGNGSHRFCDYEVKSSEIVLQFIREGKTSPLSLQVRDGGKTLTNASGDTYRKVAKMDGVDYTKSEWSRFTSREGRYSLLMYGIPTLEIQKYKNETATVEAKTYRSLLDNGMLFVYYVPLPVAIDSKNINDVYGVSDKMLTENMSENGMKIVKSKSSSIIFNGVNAREILGTAQFGSSRLKYRHVVVIHNNILYRFMTMAKPGSDTFSGNFFNSIRFVD
jgi:hypothetical protein